MRDLFTYPSNPSTYYIDPTYYGDNDSGWVKRMNHYLGLNPDNSGNSYYIGGISFTSDTTLASASTFIGKYYEYVDNKGSNYLSRYGWAQPNWVEGDWREESFVPTSVTVSRPTYSSTDVTYHITLPEITGTKWGSGHYHTFSDGDDLYVDVADDGLSSSTRFYAQETGTQANPGRITLSTASGSVVNPNVVSTLSRSVATGDLVHAIGSATRFRGNGVHNLETGDSIQFRASAGSGDIFTNVQSGDTALQENATYYIEKISNYSFDMYTDAARTTGASLTETYLTNTVSNGIFSFSNTDTVNNLEVNLQNIDISSQDSAFRTLVNTTQTEGWCRLYFNNTVGTITEDNVDCTVPIDTSLQTTNIFYYKKTATDEIKLLATRELNPANEVIADFELGTSSSTDVRMMIIDVAKEITARDVSIEWLSRSFDVTNAKIAKQDLTGNVDYYLYDATIIQKGNATFYYNEDDGSGNAQQTSGAVLADDYWNPGATSSTAYASGEKPGVTVSLSSGKFDDLSITSGGSMPYSKVSTTDYEKKAIYFVTEASNFIPTSTTLELEEQHSLDNDWDGSKDYDNTRIWPQHKKPTRAELTTVQPSSVVRAQNGTKYVRTSGVTKYQIKLDFGPMRYEDFKEFQRVVQGARGQAIPFYLNLRYSDETRLLFRNDTNKTVTVVPRLGAPQSATPADPNRGTSPQATDTTILYDGFPNNYSEITAGDLVISSKYANGNLRMVMNNPVANIFGEALVQFDRPWGETNAFHEPLHADPSHIIVTLAEDSFVVDKSIHGLYTFSVTFDADEWKD